MAIPQIVWAELPLWAEGARVKAAQVRWATMPPILIKNLTEAEHLAAKERWLGPRARRAATLQNDFAAFLKQQRTEFSDEQDREQFLRALWLNPGLHPTLEELRIENPGPELDKERKRKLEAWRKKLAKWAEDERAATADEVWAAAADERLELVPSASGETGFKCVYKHGGRYEAKIAENGKSRHLGTFATPEEGALCYARHIGVERAAAEAADARIAAPQPLTADEVWAAAAAEGLELVTSAKSKTGFKNVLKHGGKYKVQIAENGKSLHLGTFATPEEGALCYARHIGVDRAAIEAVEARVAAPQPLTADDARAAAVAEGLELVHAPAPSGPNEVEMAEALRCWHVLLSALRDDRRTQRAPSLSSPPPPSPAATTKHASRKRLAAAVACAEVLQRAVALQPQLTAESGDDPGEARCIICLVALDLSAASSRGEAACGHTPCCGNYYHKRCLSRWLQGFGESDDNPLPMERNCPTCRQALCTRALIPCLSRQRLR